MIRISRVVGYCLILAAFACRVESASAQAAAAAPKSIDVVHGGIDRLYADLDYVFGLASEPDQLKTLKETLDVFFKGVDPKKPAIIQVYVRKGKFNYVLHAPTTAPAVTFRNNLRALGLRSRPLGGGVYAVSGLFDGFMKEVSGPAPQTPATIIAEDRKDLANLGDFAVYKKNLDAKDFDFVASIVNAPGLLQERESAIEEVRKQVTPGLKKLKDESDAEFELRKLTIDQQFTEIKQIYAEAASIVGIGNISKTDKHAVFETELMALPSTPLAEGIQMLGKDPSYFANIPLNNKENTEPLSGNINFKLDAMRQKHMLAFLKQARPLIQTQIKEAEGTSAENKDYGKQTADIIFDVLDQSSKNGVLDAFVNVTVNASKLHTLVGGTQGNGDVVKKGLQTLKQTASVELDVEKVGDVSLHKVTLPPNLPELEEIFGKDLVLVVGTGPKAIWYAIGEGADAKLKEAIEMVGTPAEAKSPVLASLHVKALLWYKLFDAFRSKHKKGNEETRKNAIAAFEAGADVFDFKLELIEKTAGDTQKTLKSSLIFQEGLLRYFGKTGAKFVKENLQN